MKEKKIIIKLLCMILASIIVIVAGTVAFLALNGEFNPYTRQIKLGYKLLESGNYQEAIIAFNKAIEIDERYSKAYIGIAESYIAESGENTYENVVEILTEGYNKHYDDEAYKVAIIRFSDELEEMGNAKLAFDLLLFGYDLTGDDRMLEKWYHLAGGASDEFLKEVYNLFEEGKETEIIALMRNEVFEDLNTLFFDSKYGYIYLPQGGNGRTGKGVGLYFTDTYEYTKLFVYYGDFVDGLRHGHGVWLGANNDKYYKYTGPWAEDTPDGYGEIFTINDAGDDSVKKTHLKGPVVGGVYHGAFDIVYYSEDGMVPFFTAIAENGIFQHNGCRNSIHRSSEDEYCYAYWENSTKTHTWHLSTTGKWIHAVIGFEPDR